MPKESQEQEERGLLPFREGGPDTNSVEQSYLLSKQGRVYDALVSWFDIPNGTRSQVVRDVLTQASQRESLLCYVKQDPDLTPAESFVLSYFSTILSPIVEKLFKPSEGMQLESGLDEIGDNGIYYSYQRFMTLVKELRIDFDADADGEDFRPPARGVIQSFSTEEMRRFLLNLLPFTNPESDLFKKDFLINHVRHVDLLVDPRLAPYVEMAYPISSFPLEGLLSLYLVHNTFPLVEVFEELFRRKPDESDPTRYVRAYNPVYNQDKHIPASVYYYTFLRRIKHFPENEESKTRIVSYLLSNKFMRRALPFLETDEVYGDERFGDKFLRPGDQTMAYIIDVEATGDEARRIKRERFAEVLTAGITYLEKLDDVETAQKLRSFSI